VPPPSRFPSISSFSPFFSFFLLSSSHTDELRVATGPVSDSA
jgi:hypothetical protein